MKDNHSNINKLFYRLARAVNHHFDLNERKNRMNYERGGIAFVGCLILGSGIGMLFDDVSAGSYHWTGCWFPCHGYV